MKKKTLSLILMLLPFLAVSQIVENNEAIEFKDSDGNLDGTMIKRYSGNALRIRYAKNTLIFDALEDHPVQIRNAAGVTKIELHPNGDSKFLGGNLGIGKTPVQKLDVWGNIGWGTTGAVLNSDQGASIKLRGSGTPYIDFLNDDEENFDARLILMGNDMLELRGANLGIGLSSPQEKLHVNGNIALENNRSLIFYDNTDINDGTSIIRYNGNAFRIRYNKAPMMFDALNDQPIKINNSSSETRIQLNTNGLTYFNGGNVSIGSTTAFGYKLAVNGIIGAKEIVVENSSDWPDYVFSSEYVLPNLSEIENFINQNNHLPGIPSAKEVREKGISLGEMNAKLLEKIEELTLHIIQQEKRMDEQEKMIIKLIESKQ